MPRASVKKIIPCNKKDLINMVLDIEQYPKFVPWCLNGKIHKREERADVIELEADLTVGKKLLNQTYKSFVTYYKEKDKIIVNNIDGPLKYLKNEWRFKENNSGSLLQFEIDFELKNSILNSVMKNSFDMGLNKIANAFEKRAYEILKK
tara:strand:- start:238 stop:684 length:447 start_codon:yes stop_codon:yes gene_type:complete